MAALRAFGRGIEDVTLDMMSEHACGIMDASPVEYVKKAQLKGSIFGSGERDGSVSCASTDFFVDHTEPLEALKALKDRGVTWPFGTLPEGCEFLALVET
jgi:hypothetical protein